MNYKKYMFGMMIVSLFCYILPNLNKFSKNKNKNKHITGDITGDITGGWYQIEQTSDNGIKVITYLNQNIKEKKLPEYDEIIRVESQVVAGLNIRVLIKSGEKQFYHIFYIPTGENAIVQYLNSSSELKESV